MIQYFYPAHSEYGFDVERWEEKRLDLCILTLMAKECDPIISKKRAMHSLADTYSKKTSTHNNNTIIKLTRFPF